MIKGFKEDLAAAKPAERMVRLALESAYEGKDVTFEDVSDEKECRYKGDIKVCLGNGKAQYIDVKDDGVWARSGNLLAEDMVWYCNSGKQDGFMRHAKYNIVAYHSKKLSKILLIDFKKWKAEYKKPNNGWYKVIPHGGTQTTYGYLNPIEKMKELGVVMMEIDYSYSGTYENPSSVWIDNVKNYRKSQKAA